MFLDWKNQHWENDYTTQSNLQIQCNSYQTTNGIFHRIRTKNCTICMETQKTLNSQSNLEKEKQSWRNQASRLQTILQSYSNQDSMVLAQKQKYRSMEQDKVIVIETHTYTSLSNWSYYRRRRLKVFRGSQIFNHSFKTLNEWKQSKTSHP